MFRGGEGDRNGHTGSVQNQAGCRSTECVGVDRDVEEFKGRRPGGPGVWHGFQEAAMVKDAVDYFRVVNQGDRTQAAATFADQRVDFVHPLDQAGLSLLFEAKWARHTGPRGLWGMKRQGAFCDSLEIGSKNGRGR